MWTTGMKMAGVLVLAAVLLVGCGTAASEDAMKAKFAKVDYDMATIEEGKTPREHLVRLTRQYIALIREYADELGDAEVRRRLGDKAFELGPYCLPCVTMVDLEAENY